MKFLKLLLLCLSTYALAQVNPVPLVNNPLVPDAVAPGSQSFILTVNGTGFVSGSTVNWNGVPLATTFVSASQLTATVPAGNVAAPGTASVTVTNPGPGGGASNVALFSVREPFYAASFGRINTPTIPALFFAVPTDLNRDGNMDLVSLAPYDSAIAVLLGNGDGTFQSPVEYPVSSSSPSQVLASDFNGDGNFDLAVIDFGGTVSILLGNGDGTFQNYHDFFVTDSSCLRMASGDFDHDGKQDLAISEWYPAGEVVVLLGNGDGTFAPPVSFPAGSDSATAIIARDFNHDGNIDLAVVLHWQNEVAILLGNGDGTFQPENDYPIGLLPYDAVAADFNGDGNLDIAVVTFTGFSLILNNGDGTFQPPADYEGNPYPSSIAAADLGGNGKLDVVLSGGTPLGNLKYSTVSTFAGKGDGRFVDRSDFTVGGAPVGAAIADFDGDGKLDMVTPSWVDNTLSLLRQVTSVLSRTYLKFGNVKVGTKSSRKVKLSNIGDSPFTLNHIGLIGRNTQGFAVTDNCGPELAAGASCQITITFQPQSPIPYRHVRVKVSDSVAKQKIYLLGTGRK